MWRRHSTASVDCSLVPELRRYRIRRQQLHCRALPLPSAADCASLRRVKSRLSISRPRSAPLSPETFWRASGAAGRLSPPAGCLLCSSCGERAPAQLWPTGLSEWRGAGTFELLVEVMCRGHRRLLINLAGVGTGAAVFLLELIDTSWRCFCRELVPMKNDSVLPTSVRRTSSQGLHYFQVAFLRSLEQSVDVPRRRLLL